MSARLLTGSLACLLFLPLAYAFGEGPAAERGPRQDGSASTSPAAPEKAEMARFTKAETAAAFLEKLRESGYEGGVEEVKDETGAALYQVYILVPVDAERIGEPAASWSFLGPKGKYVHGALTLLGVGTDNAFNTRYHHKSNFTLFLIPEIWLNVPRTQSAAAPGYLEPRPSGGVLVAPYFSDLPLGYQATLYYRADIPLNSSDNSPYGSSPMHRVAAGLALKGNRFSLSLYDQFDKSYQEREAGQVISDNSRDRYDANRFNAQAVYDSNNRLILSLDFVDYRIDYHDQGNPSSDRHDYGLVPAIRYRLTSKINLLAEYAYYDVSYRDLGDFDSTEQYFTAGIEWRFTEKSRGYFKAGYETKRFDRTGESYHGFSFEMRGEHRLTPKTYLGLEAYRRTTETRVIGTSYTVSTGVMLTASHMLTQRITSTLHLSYWNEAYRGVNEESLSDTRVRDDIYQAGIEFQYSFRRWLKARLGYYYTVKHSSEPDFEYRTNTFLVGVTGSF